MTEGKAADSEVAMGAGGSSASRRLWWQRPTVRTLRKRQERGLDHRETWDRRENEETRLPADESVHLGGVVLTEAFTPSTFSALHEALGRWSVRDDMEKQEWLRELARSRSGERGGWRNLGLVQRPGDLLLPHDGSRDQEMPEGVAAIWLHVEYVLPSVTVVVATFTLNEDAGDLSPLLREDYRWKSRDVRIHVYGRFGRIRARLPWSRPARYGMSARISQAEDEKHRACEEFIRKQEDACSRWFTARFPGRFAAAPPNRRPVMRLMFTKERLPFKERNAFLRPAGLDWSPTVYRSQEYPGWALVTSHWPYRKNDFTVTVAARRKDAARESTNGERETNWYLSQRFGDYQAPLAARLALMALLAIYADRLARLRDRAGIKKRPKRLVSDARTLDNYLIGDGLDAVTIASDIERITADVRRFRRGVPEYTEDNENLPENLRDREPAELVPLLCSSLRNQALRLASDSKNTSGNIRASAQLRQAIANTRLQRMVVSVALVALALAVVSLLVSR